MSTNELGKKYVCEHCHNRFNTRQGLEVHINSAKYCLELRGEEKDSSHVCKNCKKKFTQASTLKTHTKTCKAAEIITEKDAERDLLLQRIKTLETIIKKKESVIKQKDIALKEKDAIIDKQSTKIAKRDAQLCEMMDIMEKKNKVISEVEAGKKAAEGKTEGILIGFDKGKVVNRTTNNTTNNIVKQKLAAIPTENIKPLTLEFINGRVGEYDYNAFLSGVLGVINYIKKITTLEMDDGTTEKNYACTNRSRHTFHRLIEDKNWKQDGGARCIHEILSSLAPTVKKHMDKLIKEVAEEDYMSPMKEVLSKKQQELQSIEFGIVNRNSKERDELFSHVKNRIKDTNFC